MNPGKVFLVGAGPGDPALITVKGRDVLSTASAVLYDNLSCPALLDLAPTDAERIYVGKKKSAHSWTQEEIIAMLVERARKGLRVVRLKGGDPYIFGRGGEEAEALADAGVAFEVVPGVASPLGIAAYCGVPLTHRDHTSVVTFITGHDVGALDWTNISRAETLVVLMGLTNAREICQVLIANGRPADTPALAVRWATLPKQTTVIGSLATLPDRIEASRLRPPATLVVGEVVRLAEKLNWYEKLPLFGQRVVVTRAAGQADALAGRLRALGADAIELPAIEICPAPDYRDLDAAIERLESYDWLIFTSANGVRYFLGRLDRSRRDLRAIRGRICAIGPATRKAMEGSHLKVDVVGREYVAESLLEALAGESLAGKRILLARALVARDLLPNTLRERGATVDVCEAYRTLAPENLSQRIGQVFTAKPDWITFTSSSTVQNFADHAPDGALEGVRVASIGPVTTATARSLGIHVHVEASRFDVDGLLEAILTKGIIEA